MIYIILILLILVIYFASMKFAHKCMCMGLIYFAMTRHDWKIDEKEAKQILEYAMKKRIKEILQI